MAFFVKEDLIGLYARYRWLKTGLAILLALLFIQVGRNGPFWTTSTFRDLAFDVISGIVITYFAFSLIEYIQIQLDVHCNWCTMVVRRALLQIFLGVFLPLAVVMLFYFCYGKLYYQDKFDLSRSLFFKVDMPVAFLMLILVNVYYSFIYFLHHTKAEVSLVKKESVESISPAGVNEITLNASEDAPTMINTKVLLATKGQKQHIVEVDQIAYIVIKGELISVYLFNGTSYWLNESLENIEKTLPSCFFRANRQWIINFKAVQSFITEKSGRLILDIAPDTDAPVIVSQRKAQEFKTWLLTQQ